MEALIASKLNPHKVQRTSLTIHMHEASVTLHAAINGIKPALMKRKMLREIEHGVTEVVALEQIKRGLQSEDRIICEELVALHDRKYDQSLEVAKEQRRLARCLENLEKKQDLRNQAEDELANADNPLDFLEDSLSAAERLTDRRLKDFATFIDNKTEGIHQSTKYAFDVLSILLGESMPKPKEIPIVLQVAYEELVEINTQEEDEEEYHEEEEGDTNENSLDGSNEHENLNAEENENENKQDQIETKQDSNENEATPLDAVARATAEHRKAIGLEPVTKRTSQQSAFLNALVPKTSNDNISDTEEHEEHEEQEDQEESDKPDDAESSTSNPVPLDPEEAVKAYSRSTRQDVIEEIGRDEWVTMSWEERLEHMIEFAREEDKEEPFQTVEDYEDDVFARNARYFESTVDEGTARHPNGDNTYLIERKKKESVRVGILSDEKYPQLIQRLIKLSHKGEEALTSLVNDEKDELMEGYLDFQNICRYTLWLGRSGELGADIWAWILAVLDYTRALPIWNDLVDALADANDVVDIAQEIYDVAAAREAASSLKLKKIVALIPQTAWYRRRQQKYIQDHQKIMTQRTKWPVYLRPLDAPAKFAVMVQQVASMRGKTAKLIRDFKKALAQVHFCTKNFSQASNRLGLVEKEVDEVLCPWNWYMPGGRKWADIIHNKWFVPGGRVTVRNEETGLETPATLTDVQIHENGRGRWGDVKYDNGSSEEEISHIRINLQYPQRVPMSRAMEDHQDKFVATIFDTACETPILLNIKLTVPKLEKHLNRMSITYEDTRTALHQADQSLYSTASKIIQCIWRRYKRSRSMKKVRTWKSGEKMRAFLSANLIKFRKMKEHNNAFAVRLLSRVKGSINIQRILRGHFARIIYWDILESIAEAERQRLARIEQIRQEKEFANRLRAAQIAKERTKGWRCPRCPLSIAFKQRFTSREEIDAHIAIHDEKLQEELEEIEAKAAHEMEEKRLALLQRKSKEQLALAKMRDMMEARRIKMEAEAIVKAKKQREKKLQQMNALFTIKYQRPVLPSLRKGGFKSYANDDFMPTKLAPPYPELRLVRNAMRPSSATNEKWKINDQNKRRALLPEKIFITCSPFRFGRSRSCDAPLDCYQHPGLVSKDHALIFVRGSPIVGYTLILADLHSTNGTFVNQKRIKAGTGTEYDKNNRTFEEGEILVFGCTKSQPTPENPGGVVLSTVVYQLWKNGSGFHDDTRRR